MNNQTYLQNEYLRLRNMEPEDLDVIFRIENDSRLWEVSGTSVPFSRFVLKQYLETTQCDLFTDKQLRLMVERLDSGAIAGIADLADFDPLHNRAAVGITIKDEYKNQGIGTQVLNLLCEYCSGYLHLNQLYAYIAYDNIFSLKLFNTCGFTESGRLKEWIHSENGYKDTLIVQKLFH